MMFSGEWFVVGCRRDDHPIHEVMESISLMMCMSEPVTGCDKIAHTGSIHPMTSSPSDLDLYISVPSLTAHRGCVHLIIDTEDYVDAAPAEGEGDRPHSDEGESAERAAAAATLQLLQEELLPRLFPGVTPQRPSHGMAGASGSSTTIVQLQQSVFTLENGIQKRYAMASDSSRYNAADTIEAVASSAGSETPSNTYCAIFETPPPSVLRVHPAAVCCQTPSLSPLASPPDDAVRFPVSGGSWITVWLQLSAPLPSEGITLLARYRGGFLDARLERADDIDDALIIKVREFRITCGI